MKKIIATTFFALSAMVLVSGCSSSSDSTPAPATLTGTAATGLPIDGTVYIKDAKGTEKSIATAANGSFTLDVPGMTPPYLLKITPSSGPELYSFASKNGQTVNLTPTTNLAMFLAYGKKDLNTLYVGWDGTGVDANVVATAEGTVRANLKTRMEAKGLDVASFDLFSTAFKADGSGIDGVMDALKIAVNPGAGNYTFTDLSDVDLGFDEALMPPAAPATPPPANAISILTVTGKMHTLNGLYETACALDGAGSRKDTVTITGDQWINSSINYSDVACQTVASQFAITSTIAKGADKVISGWKISQGGAPDRQDGNGKISDTEMVSTFTLDITNVDDPAGVAGSIPLGPYPGVSFYVFDDTATGQFAMYRDKDGSIAGKSDPYIVQK